MNSFFFKLMYFKVIGRKDNVYKICFIFIMAFISVLSVRSQTPENAKDRIKKSELSIKPNSRDINVNLRDNSFKQVRKQRNQMMLKKMQHARQKKISQKNINQNRRQDMMQQRRKMIQTRRNTRR